MNVHKILKVVNNDLCISCGACVNACRLNNIVPTFNVFRGSHEVKIINPKICTKCKNFCYSVCPSISVDFTVLMNNKNETYISKKSVFIGYAPDYKDNKISSSGGIIRALIRDFIRKNKPVVCLGFNGNDYSPIIVTSIKDLKKIPGSIYHSISFTDSIRFIKEQNKPCLLVALPCQLAGILKYIHYVEPALNSKIDLKVGLICGWSFSKHSQLAFAQYKRIKGIIIDVRYRGEDKIGKLKFYMKDGNIYQFNRRNFANFNQMIDYKICFGKEFHRMRCRICQDHINLLADISVGDAWLKRVGGDKQSIIIPRTANGLKVLNNLYHNEDIIMNKGNEKDITESQSYNLVYGYSARQFGYYLRKRGKFVTEFINFGSNEYEKISFKKLFFYRKELLLRRILRSGRYRFYKYLFIVINFNMLKSFILQFFKKNH